MLGFIEGLVLGVIAGGVICFFVWKNNKAKFTQLEGLYLKLEEKYKTEVQK